MNKSRLLGTVCAVVFTYISSPANAASVVSLAGDIDNFGTGTPSLDPISVLDVSSDPSDGDFDKWNLTSFSWQHIFSLPTGNISSATLTIVTLDMEDAGEGDGQGGGPFDDLLFLDSVELPGAFDDVFSPDSTSTGLQTPNVSVFNLPVSLFPLLADGLLDITVDAFGGSQHDAISIDYARIDIQTVPIPAALWLFGSGLLGLIGVARKKAA